MGSEMCIRDSWCVGDEEEWCWGGCEESWCWWCAGRGCACFSGPVTLSLCSPGRIVVALPIIAAQVHTAILLLSLSWVSAPPLLWIPSGGCDTAAMRCGMQHWEKRRIDLVFTAHVFGFRSAGVLPFVWPPTCLVAAKYSMLALFSPLILVRLFITIYFVDRYHL